MAAITIDSPRWLDGWGEPLSRPAPPPALRAIGSGTRRPDPGLVHRRRLAALLLAAVVVAAALGVASVALSRPATAGSPAVGRQTHVVEAGETYWSIASGLEHDGDLRVTVDALVDANGARPLFPGDRIEIP